MSPVLASVATSRRAAVLLGLALLGALIAGVGYGQAQPPGCDPQIQISARAFRVGKAEEVSIPVIHSTACRAAITVTAADGKFERLPISSGAHRAFRLDAGNLCKVTRIERALLPPDLSARALMRRGVCEPDVLALAFEPLSSPGPGATAVRSRQACAIVPVFARLRSPAARARRETIAVDVTVASVSPPPGTKGGPFEETDDIRIRLANPSPASVAAPIAGFPVDRAQLRECDAR